jgi:hypothetical protein
MPKARWEVLILIAIILGLSVQVWAALHWASNFDADEANFGLVAVGMMRGDFAPYFPVKNTLGTLESLVAAGIMEIIGVTIFSVRLSAILFYGIFLIALAFLVKRWSDYRTAFVALLLAAFPSWKILWWTYRPVGCFSPLLGLTAVALVLGVTSSAPWRWRYARQLVFGIVLGLAVWEHPLTLYYMLAMGLVYILSTPEWSWFYQKLSRHESGARALLKLLPVLATLGVFLTMLFSFVLGGGRPPRSLTSIRFDLLILFFLLGSALLVWLFAQSQRKRHLCLGGATILAGFCVGNLPQWGSMIFRGLKPSSSLTIGSLSGLPSRLYVGISQILPSIWGVPHLGPDLAGQSHEIQEMPRTILWSSSALLQGLWIILMLVVLYSVLAFFWKGKKDLISMLSLKPLPVEGGRNVILGLLFILPIVVGLSAGNSFDVASVRYFIPAWHAGIIILALGLNSLCTKRRTIGFVLVALWIISLGFVNLREIHAFWHNPRHQWCSSESVQTLKKCLEDNQVQGVYADYGLVAPLSFLYQENPVFTTYNNVDIYPAYSKQVQSKHRLAIILPTLATLPDSAVSIEDLTMHLKNFFGHEPNGLRWSKRLDERLQGLSFIKREKIMAYWDVWIFHD